MLPSGPRYTYPLPPGVQPGSRELARQILATIKEKIEKAGEVRTGMMTTGCDGQPVINPLDGSSCNGEGGQKVLFNPQTRQILGAYPARGLVRSDNVHPADCSLVRARLRKKRRFTDDLGNMYGPDGEWLSPENPPAALETDYVHEYQQGYHYKKSGDPPTYQPSSQITLKKTFGAPAERVGLTLSGTYTGVSFNIPGVSQGLFYPSLNDEIAAGVVGMYLGEYDGTNYNFDGLNDATFTGPYPGSDLFYVLTIVPWMTVTGTAVLDDLVTPATSYATYTGTSDATFDVEITTGGGGTNKFKWRKNGGSYTTNVNCSTSDIILTDGFRIKFGSATGHTLGDQWSIAVLLGNESLGRPDMFTVDLGGASFAGAKLLITGGVQSLGSGLFVQFGSLYGHKMRDQWTVRTGTTIVTTRNGVAARGLIDTATPCINGGFPNSNVIVTTEQAANFSAFAPSFVATGSTALVVRDANTLALLYRKALDHDATAYAFASPGQKFSFSANDEGFFAMQCYTEPALTSPPTPYPGHEFGAPNARVVAIVLLNPLTFEPTIEELITLEENERTIGSTFATMTTLP